MGTHIIHVLASHQKKSEKNLTNLVHKLYTLYNVSVMHTLITGTCFVMLCENDLFGGLVYNMSGYTVSCCVGYYVVLSIKILH